MNDFHLCKDVKELLSPYFDGELCEKDKKIVKKHLKSCLTCRRELENIKQLSVLIKSAYFKKEKQDNKRKVVSSIAALIFLIFLGWFSISMIAADKGSEAETEKPMYVRAEEYFLEDVYKQPPEEVISLIYAE